MRSVELVFYSETGVLIKYIFWPVPEGTSDKFLDENKSTQKILKSVWIDSDFYADFKYAIGFGEISE